MRPTRYAYILYYQVKPKRFLEKKREKLIINQFKLFKQMKKLFFLMALIVTVMVIASCNVTRTTTTTASTYQRGDTTIMVQTKTVESYDATKKN